MDNKWKERLVIEYRELVDKIARLDNFIELTKNDKTVNRDILLEQLEIMYHYLEILEKRLIIELTKGEKYE